MTGNKLLVDTNIALYLFQGNKTILKILSGAEIYVSFITQLELLSFSGLTFKERIQIKRFLSDCTVIDINEEIKNRVVSIRQKKKLRMPDSIIAATSLAYEIPLLTADGNFKHVSGLDLVFFEADH